MKLNQFINQGSDEALLKSLQGDDVHVNQQELSKSINKAGLVQKEVTVQTKHGTFTRKQWVKAGESKNESESGIQESSGKYSGKNFGFKEGGEKTADMMNNINKVLGVENFKIDTPGYGTALLKNGESIKFGMTSDGLSVNVTWKGSVISGSPESIGDALYRKMYNKSPSKNQKDSSDNKISSYEGKTESEMRVLFDGKTALDVQNEKSRIFNEMGKPSGSGTEKYKEFKRAVAPLDGLISETINNGTGTTSGDYTTLLKTSKVLAKPEDKKSISSYNSNHNENAKNDYSKSKKYNPFQIGEDKVIHYINRKKFPIGGNSSASLAGKNAIEVLSGQSKEFTSKMAKNEAIRATKEALRSHKKGLKDSNYRDVLYSIEELQRIVDSETELLNILENTSVKGEVSQSSVSHKPSIEESPTSIQKLSKEDAKKKTQSFTSKVGKTDDERKAFMEKVKSQGITWKESNDNGTEVSVAINWMRCCMAMNKHFANGGKFNNSTSRTRDKSSNESLVKEFMKYHDNNDNYKNNQDRFDKMYDILDKYGSENEDVDKVFKRASESDQKKMIELIRPR